MSTVIFPRLFFLYILLNLIYQYACHRYYKICVLWLYTYLVNREWATRHLHASLIGYIPFTIRLYWRRPNTDNANFALALSLSLSLSLCLSRGGFRKEIDMNIDASKPVISQIGRNFIANIHKYTWNGIYPYKRKCGARIPSNNSQRHPSEVSSFSTCHKLLPRMSCLVVAAVCPGVVSWSSWGFLGWLTRGSTSTSLYKTNARSAGTRNTHEISSWQFCQSQIEYMLKTFRAIDTEDGNYAESCPDHEQAPLRFDCITLSQLINEFNYEGFWVGTTHWEEGGGVSSRASGHRDRGGGNPSDPRRIYRATAAAACCASSLW